METTKTVKTNRYMIVYSTANHNKWYLIDRYATLKPGDVVAINLGKVADIEILSNKNKDKYIIGKAISVGKSL